MKIKVDKINKIIYTSTAYFCIFSLLMTIYNLISVINIIPFSIQSIRFSFFALVIIDDWQMQEDWIILVLGLAIMIIPTVIIIAAIINLFCSKKSIVFLILSIFVYCCDLAFLLFLVIKNISYENSYICDFYPCIITDVIMISIIITGIICKRKYLETIRNRKDNLSIS